MTVPRSQWRTASEVARDRIRYTTAPPRDDFRPLDFYRGKRILLWTRKPGFGDMVMNAMCCDILRTQFELDVWYGLRGNACDRDFAGLFADVPCYAYSPDLRAFPLRDNRRPRGFVGGVDHTGASHRFDFILDFRYRIGLESNVVFQCLQEFGICSLKLPWRGLQVRHLDLAAEAFDVVLCTTAGGWKPVRGYRRTPELVETLRRRGLSVCDLSQADVRRLHGTRGLLSLVARAKAYVGVETGPTHLVAGVHRQAVIIQSGIHASAFWNIYDRTHVVEADWPCGGRKCRVRRHDECPIPAGVCIDRFAPNDIADFILEALEPS